MKGELFLIFSNVLSQLWIPRRLAHHKEPQRGNPTTERGRRTDVPAKQVVGQQLHCQQGQVFGCAATQPQGDVSGAFSGSGPGYPTGCPGAHLQESQKCSGAESMCPILLDELNHGLLFLVLR